MNQTLAILKFFKEAGYSGLYLKASVTQHNGKEPPKTGATIVFITKPSTNVVDPANTFGIRRRHDHQSGGTKNF
jgi:hypothetical protein